GLLADALVGERRIELARIELTLREAEALAEVIAVRRRCRLERASRRTDAGARLLERTIARARFARPPSDHEPERGRDEDPGRNGADEHEGGRPDERARVWKSANRSHRRVVRGDALELDRRLRRARA